MSTPSPSNDSGHARRVIVSLVIATAAAAVTAGVALQRTASPEPGGLSGQAVPAAVGTTPTATGMPLSDPSLPAAADAMPGVSGSGEPAPTF